MSARVRERLFSILLELGFFLEPLAPPAITYFLARRLDHLKDQGKILEYKTRTKRLGKFHYAVELDLDLTGEQAFHAINDALPKQLKHVRR